MKKMKFYFILFIFNLSPIYGQNTEEECFGGSQRVVGFYSGTNGIALTEYQANLLTHLVFGDVTVDLDGTLHLHSRDIFVQTLSIARKNANLQFLVNLIEAEDEENNIFWQIFSDSQSRQNLIAKIHDFLVENRLDGVNVDWHAMDPTMTNAKQLLIIFLAELAEEFQHEFIISITSPNTKLSGSYHELRYGYDLPELSVNVEFFNVKSYNYYEPGEPAFSYTGPNAPLYRSEKLANRLTNRFAYAHETMRYYACSNGNTYQINLGIPLFANAWYDIPEHFMWADLPPNRLWLKTNSSMRYRQNVPRWEIAYTHQIDNESVFDEDTMSSYLYDAQREHFYAIENTESIKSKIEYAKRYGIGGYFFYSVEHVGRNDSILEFIQEQSKKCAKIENYTEYM